MTSIFVGSGLGFLGGSLTQTNGYGASGSPGVGGQGRDRSYVDAATGNLVLQSQDEFIAAVGLDDSLLRTYNSLGLIGAGGVDPADSWRLSVYRSLGGVSLTVGTVTHANITRTGADGHVDTYVYNANYLGTGSAAWVAADGSGTNPYITYNTVSGQWTWHEGGTSATELYDASGKLLSTTDANGNTLTYTFTGSQLTQVKDASGQIAYLDYDASNRLTDLRVVGLVPGATSSTSTQTLIRVGYGYDSQNRLSSVYVDLSVPESGNQTVVPGTGSLTGSAVFTTTYTYQSTTSNLITRIAQSDGSVLSIGYDSSSRVTSLTDGLGRVTGFDYSVAGQTKVTDPLGNATIYVYDASQRLTQVVLPSLNGASNSITYQYDASNNITQVTDAEGRTVKYTYDGHGKLVDSEDSLGNTVTRAYDAADHLLFETRYTTAAPVNFNTGNPSGALTTYYVYDTNENLRFVVSPQGRVTEYRYAANGERTSTIVYTGGYSTGPYTGTYSGPDSGTYSGPDASNPNNPNNISGYIPSKIPSLSDMTSWASAQVQTQSQRSDITYDLTGQVKTVTTYSATNADGTGGGTASVTHYVYDLYGRLLMQIDPRNTSLNPASANPYGSSTGYGNGNYGTGQAQVTSYAYDGLNRVLKLQNGVGQTTATLYGSVAPSTTASGSPITIIVTAPNGTQTLTTEDADGEVTNIKHQTSSGTALDGPGINEVYDADGNLVKKTDAILLTTTYVYDVLGRQRFQIDPAGDVTEMRYDASGKLVQTIQHAVQINSASLPANPKPSDVLALLNGGGFADDFYSGLSSLYTVSGSGIQESNSSLVVTALSSGASQAIGTRATTINSSSSRVYRAEVTLTAATDNFYFGAVNSAGTFSQMALFASGSISNYTNNNGTPTYVGTGVPYTVGATYVVEVSVSSAGSTLYVYLKGKPRSSGYVSPLFSATWGDARTRILANPSSSQVTIVNNLTETAALPNDGSADRVSNDIYDAAGRLAYSVDAGGYVTGYSYDGAGHLLSKTQYYTPLAGELRPDTPASAISVTTNSLDRTTLYFYDSDGRQIATLDADGYLSQTVYNAAGQVQQTIAYATLTNPSYRAGPLSQLIPASDPAHDRLSYTFYDAEGRVSAKLDAAYVLNGTLYYYYYTANSYDVAGNLSSQKRYATAITYSGSGVPTAPSTSSNDQLQTWQYDNLNRVYQQTDYQGTSTLYNYDNSNGNATSGLLLSTTSAATGSPSSPTAQNNALNVADARTTTYLYDPLGRVTTILLGVGSAAYNAATAANKPSVAANYGTQSLYDNAGRKIESIDPDGNKSFYYYDGAGRLAYTVDGAGDVGGTKYDAFGDVVKSVEYATPISLSGLNGGPVPTTTTGDVNFYNAVINNSAFQTNSLNRATAYSYGDARGFLTQTTDALGFVATRAYDHFGELQSQTTDVGASHAAGLTRTDTYSYNNRGLLTQTVQDSGGLALSTVSGYDAFGRALQVRDPNGNLTSTQYDALGRVVTTIDGLGNATLTTYDAFDRVLTRTDRTGAVTSYSYTDAGQALTVTDPLGNSITTVSNRHGQTIKVTDATGAVTTYAYDLDGNRTSSTDADGNLTSSSYDDADLLASATDANGVVTSYSYDAAKRVLTKSVDPTGLNLQTKYAYNAFSQAYQVTDPNGVVTTTVFDNKGESAGVIVDSGGLSLGTSYTYDGEGRTLTVTEGLSGSLSTAPSTWTASANTIPKVTQYVYDKLGRRTSQIVDAGTGTNPASGQPYLNLTTAYTYDNDNNLIQKVDANGNTWRSVYDADNRNVYNIDPLGDVVGYQYDAEGRVTQTAKYATPISLTGLPANPEPQFITALLSGGFADGFTTGLGGYSISGGTGIAEANGNLVLTAQSSASYTLAYGTRVYTLGASNAVTFRAEFTPTAATGNFFFGANSSSGATFSHMANFYNGQIRGYTFNSSSSFANLGNYSVGTTYVIEVVVTSGGSTLYVYAKGGTRASGVSQTLNVAWANAETRIQVSQANNEVAYLDNLTETPTATGNPNDRVSCSVYDNAGRVLYSIDSVGDVTGYVYDNDGRVVRTTHFYTKVTPPTVGASYTASGVAATVGSKAGDETAANVYDATGRLIYAINAAGDVTGYVYDANGNVTLTTLYSTPLAAPTVSSIYTASGVVSAVGSAGETSTSIYDGDNRLAFNVNPLGDVTGYTYDNDGRLLTTTQYARPLLGDMVSNSGGALGGVNGWSGSISAMSASGTPFADNGEVLQISNRDVYGGTFSASPGQVFNAWMDAAVGTSTYPAAIGLQFKDASGNVIGWWWGNSASPSTSGVQTHVGGQITAPAGTATATVWLTNNGPAGSTGTWYCRNIFVAPAIGGTMQWLNQSTNRLVAIQAALVSSAADETTINTYDADGNVSSVTDADGYKQTYTHDGLGNKLTYVNQVGNQTPQLGTTQAAWQAAHTWTYRYDAAGRLTDQLDPAASVDLNGDTSVAGTQVRIAAHYTYTDDGDLATQADGYYDTAAQTFTAQRTTTYTYDADRRQIGVSMGSVGGIASGVGASGATETSSPVQTWTAYDGHRNAIVGMDAAGAYSYKIYDSQNRLSYEVDGMGYVTAYTYDAFGNQLTVSRYSTAINLVDTTLTSDQAALKNAFTATPNGVAVQNAAMQAQARVLALIPAATSMDAAHTRTITTAYDALNRKAQVAQSVVSNYVSGGAVTSATPTTVFTYDAFGNLIAQSVLQSQTNLGTVWSYTDYAYDAANQRIATLDPMGYLTQDQYDAFGNIVRDIQYAKVQATPGATGLAGLASLTASPDPTDRTVVSGYDQLNRQTSLTNKNATYAVHPTASTTATVTGDLVSYTQYDAVGNVIATTDDSGAVTRNYYDNIGRLYATAAPSRQSVSSKTPFTLETVVLSAAMTSEYEYQESGQNYTNYSLNVSWQDLDALGSGQIRVNYNFTQNSNTYTTTGPSLASGSTSTNISLLLMGSGSATFSNFSLQKQILVNGAQQWVTIVTLSSAAPASGQPVTTETGILVQSGVATPTLTLSGAVNGTNYSAGLAFSQIGDGIYNFAVPSSTQLPAGNAYGYTGTVGGNPVSATNAVTITRPAGQQPTVTLHGVSQVSPLTWLQYDALGDRVVQTRYAAGAQYDANNNLVTPGNAGTSDPQTVTTYNSVGWATSVKDADGNTTNTAYDADGRAIEIWSAQTDAVSGAMTQATSYGYDADGHQLTTTRYIQDPVSGSYTDTVTAGYDAFGEQTSQSMPLVSAIAPSATATLAESLNYDNDGHLSSVAQNGVTTSYYYDLQGNTTAKKTGETGVNDETDYALDADGRVVKEVQPSAAAAAVTAASPVQLLAPTASEVGWTVTHSGGGGGGGSPAVASGGTGQAAGASPQVTTTGKTTLSAVLSWAPLNAPSNTPVSITINYNGSASDTFVLNVASWQAGARVTWTVTDPNDVLAGAEFDSATVSLQTSSGSWVVVRSTQAAASSAELDLPTVYGDTLINSSISYTGPSSGTLSLTPSFPWIYTFSTAGLANGTYNYSFALSEGVGHLYTTYSGSFTVSGGAITWSSVSQPSAAVPGGTTPVVTQNLDRWGNVLQSADALGNVTSYTYDDRNHQLTQTRASVSAYGGLANANVSTATTVSPETLYQYDADGRLNDTTAYDVIGGNLAQSEQDQKFYDGAGQLIDEVDALGNQVQHVYDSLGNEAETILANGDQTLRAFDKMGRVRMQQTLGYTVASSGAADPRYTVYTYNEQGNRTAQDTGITLSTSTGTILNADGTENTALLINPRTAPGDGAVTQYRYDTAGNVVQTLNPGSTGTSAGSANTTTTVWDSEKHQVEQVDGDGHTQSWTYNGNDNLATYTDIAGIVTTYTYDGLNRLLGQTSTVVNETVNGSAEPAGGQALYYTYTNNGWVQSIADDTNHTITYYEYDLDGNRITEREVGDWVSGSGTSATRTYAGEISDTRTLYDTEERAEYVASSTGELSYRYDEFGNRREVYAAYYTGTAAYATSSEDDWYTYDQDNRIVWSQGSLSNGAVTWNTTSYKTTFNGYNGSGDRALMQQYEKSGMTWSQATYNYSYDPDDRLVNTLRNGSLYTQRSYDHQGRMTEYDSYGNSGNGQPVSGATRRLMTYNAQGQLNQQEYDNGNGSGWSAQETVIYFNNSTTTGLGYDGAGNLQGYQVIAGSSWTQKFVYQYLEIGSSYKEAYIDGTGTTGTGSFIPGTTLEFYDSNGNQTELEKFGTNPPPTEYFIQSLGGEIVETKTVATVSGFATAAYNVSNFYSYANNDPIGSISTDSTVGVDFDFNYTPVSDQYPASNPGDYVIQTGDTLQSIAQNVYGDASLWYLIADANALSASSTLVVGQIVTVPNQITNIHNNVSTHQPYNPQKIIGDTTPKVTYVPPAPSHAGCGLFAEVIILVVAAVVSYFVGPEVFAEVYGAMEAGTAATLAASAAAGAVAGAAADVAAQVTGDALGVSHGFSLSKLGTSILEGAAGGAVSGGVVAAAQTGGILAGTGGFTQGLIAGAGGSITAQGVGMAIGAQKSFSWSSVAAAAAAGAAEGGLSSKGVQSEVGIDNNSAYGAFKGVLGGLASGLTKFTITGQGKLQVADIVADGFGNAVGDSMAAANQQKAGDAQAASDQTAANLNSYDRETNPAPPLATQSNAPAGFSGGWGGGILAPFYVPPFDTPDSIVAGGGSSAPGVSAPSDNSDSYTPPSLKAAVAALFEPQIDEFNAEVDVTRLQERLELNAAFDTAAAQKESDFLASHPDYIEGRRIFGNSFDVPSGAFAALGLPPERSPMGPLQVFQEGASIGGMSDLAAGVTWLSAKYDAAAQYVDDRWNAAVNWFEAPNYYALDVQAQLRKAANAGSSIHGDGSWLGEWVAGDMRHDLEDVRALANFIPTTRGEIGLDVASVADPALRLGGGGLSVLGDVSFNGLVRAADIIAPNRIGISGFRSVNEFADAAYLKYQGFVDQGYSLALQAQQNGTLRISTNVNAALGTYTDEFARRASELWLQGEGIAEGPGQLVQINRYLLDPLGTGAYRIPDWNIPGAFRTYDATVSAVGKWFETTPQVLDFYNFSGGSRITIVRPSQFGSYSLLPPYSVWPR